MYAAGLAGGRAQKRIRTGRRIVHEFETEKRKKRVQRRFHRSRPGVIRGAGGKAEIDGKRYCADQGELLIPLLAAGFTVTVTSS